MPEAINTMGEPNGDGNRALPARSIGDLIEDLDGPIATLRLLSTAPDVREPTQLAIAFIADAITRLRIDAAAVVAASKKTLPR